MQHNRVSIVTTGLICAILLVSSSLALALDSNPKIQDRYSSPSTGRVPSPPSSGREPVTKKQPTTEQKFNLIFSKLSKLEQTVVTLQNQVST